MPRLVESAQIALIAHYPSSATREIVHVVATAEINGTRSLDSFIYSYP